MQLCIENLDQAGGCSYNYACAYTDTISWASPTEPLPMIRDPRVAFDQLFGAGDNAADRAARRKANQSILDWITGEVAELKRELGAADRSALDKYLEDIRELERRIQAVEARNASGEARELPERAGRRAGFVRRAHEADVRLPGARLPVRHDARVLVQDGPRRVEPRVSRRAARTRASTRRRTTAAREAAILEFNKINRYHVSMLPYFLDKLKNTMEGDSEPARQDGRSSTARRWPTATCTTTGAAR